MEQDKENSKKIKEVLLDDTSFEYNLNGSKKEPKIATIFYHDKEILFSDFSSLDKYLEEKFIPNHLRFSKKYSINYIVLSEITRLGFNLDEIKYIISYLKEKYIFVSGHQKEFKDEFSNYIWYGKRETLQDTKPLDFREQERLLDLYQKTKDISIRNKIAEGNIRLVYYTLSTLKTNCDISYPELMSYGFEGLILAIERFDASLGNSFSTFAYKYILGYVKRGIRDQFPSFRNYSSFYHAKRVIEGMYQRPILNDDTLIEEVLDVMETSGDITSKERAINREKIYFHQKLFFDDLEESKITSSDSILYSRLDTSILREKLEEVLRVLSQEESKLIKLYYGFDEEKLSVSEISKLENISRQRVSYVLKRALKKIRNSIYMEELEKFREIDLNNLKK